MCDPNLRSQGIQGEPCGQASLPNAVPDHGASLVGLKKTKFDRKFKLKRRIAQHPSPAFDHAEPLLLRVIGEKKEHADALTLLGLIAMKRERPEQQLAYYERAVFADPRHALQHRRLQLFRISRHLSISLTPTSRGSTARIGTRC